MTKPLNDQSIAELAEQIKSGSLSSVTLIESIFDHIDSLEPHLHAFKLLTRDAALTQARLAEQSIANGHYIGPLHGIPYVAKDLYNVKGLPTMAGCSLLESNIAEEDSTVVHRLKQAGAILIGKTHTVQFALGGAGINHDHGTPHNPWHQTPHTPGGSSSGTAVAVSSSMVPMGLGTDTGGSVRIPSSLCGIIGLKTTVGRISRKGVYPLSTTLDSVGPLARSVEDCALTYQVLQGPDEDGDETTRGQTPHDVTSSLKLGVKNLRIHFAESVFWNDVDPEVETAVRQTGEVFKSQGAIVESIKFREAEEALTALMAAGIPAIEGYAVNQKLMENHESELDPIVSKRLALGSQVMAVDYYKTLRKLELLCKKTLHQLSDIDALIVPTTPIPALPLSLVDQDLETYFKYNGLFLRNTVIGNALNLCGVSIPCGITKKGLPIGLMIYAKPFQEEMALRIAYAYEQSTSHTDMKPKLDWLN